MNARKSRGLRSTTTPNSSSAAVGLAIWLGLVSAAHAQTENQATSLSLGEFAGLVDEGLPEDALVRASVLDAEADVERAKALPELGVSLERQQVFVDGEGVVLQNSVAIGWSLDISGRRGLRIDAADASLRAARLRGERAHAVISIEATAIYLQAVRARQRLESLQKAREPLARLTDSLTRRAKEGDVSGADVARFALALSDLGDRIARAEAELEVAERRLAALLGRPGRIMASGDLALPQTPTQAPAEASAARPDLRAADEEIAGGRALIRAASRWWIPTLDLSVGYLSTDSGPGADVAHGYLAALSLSLPIFSRGQAEQRRGEAQVARAQATKAVLERRVRAEVEAARTLLSSRIRRARDHEDHRLVLAADLVQKTEAAYGGGEATALELRDAYEKSADARLRAIDLRYDARLAELELLRAQGIKPEGAPR